MTGVWIVYTFDMGAIVTHAFPEGDEGELAARRQADSDGYGYVNFLHFGQEVREAVK